MTGPHFAITIGNWAVIAIGLAGLLALVVCAVAVLFEYAVKQLKMLAALCVFIFDRQVRARARANGALLAAGKRPSFNAHGWKTPVDP
jgi:hypothetical protein